MANANITTVQVTNTFDEWRVATNDLISDRNILRNSNYVKDNNNFDIANGAMTISRSTGGTLLVLGGQGSALVGGTTTTSSLIVSNNASVANILTVTGNTILNSNLSVSKNTVVSQNANVLGTLNVGSILEVTGNTSLLGNLAVGKNATVAWNITSGNLAVTQNTSTGNLAVTQNTLTGNLVVSTLANIVTGNIATAYINSLTVTQPIAAPASTTDSGYIVRFGQTTDADGFFRVQRSVASGNAEIYWDDTTTDSWKFLVNGSPANIAVNNITATNNISVSNITVTGNITANINSTLKSVKEYIEQGTSSGATTVNLLTSNWFKYSLTGSSTYTFINAPANGNVFTVTLVLVQGSGGGKTVNWGNTIYWTGGQVPPATTTATGNTDVWTFSTYDGGSTFIGTLAVKDAR